MREKFFAGRCADTAALIIGGQASGQLRSDLDPELAIELLFGGIVFRLFNGLEPPDADGATALGQLAVRAIVSGDC